MKQIKAKIVEKKADIYRFRYLNYYDGRKVLCRVFFDDADMPFRADLAIHRGQSISYFEKDLEKAKICCEKYLHNLFPSQDVNIAYC